MVLLRGIKNKEKLNGARCQAKKEVFVDIGQITVKEILEKRLGAEKVARVLKEINDVYHSGKSEEEFQEHLTLAVKKEGLDPGEIKFVVTPIYPVL